MKRIGKSNILKFETQTTYILQSYCFKYDYDVFSYTWSKTYDYLGKFEIWIDLDPKSYIYSIFTRFDKPEIIKNHVNDLLYGDNLNQYSGKYNHHCNDLDSIVSTLDTMLMNIENINNELTN
jgi:hypothetical protein